MESFLICTPCTITAASNTQGHPPSSPHPQELHPLYYHSAQIIHTIDPEHCPKMSPASTVANTLQEYRGHSVLGQSSSHTLNEARRTPQSWWDCSGPATVSWHGPLSSCQFRGTKSSWHSLREQKGLCAAVHLELLARGVWGATLADELLPDCGEVIDLQGELSPAPLHSPLSHAPELISPATPTHPF